MQFDLPDSWFTLAQAEKASVPELEQHLAKIAMAKEVPDVVIDYVRQSCFPRRLENPRLRDENGVQLRHPKTNKPLRTVNENYAAEVAQDRIDAIAMIAKWAKLAGDESKRLAPILTAAKAKAVDIVPVRLP